MDIGGKKDKKNDKEDKNKDKREGKKLAEEEMPRNKKYLEKEKQKGKQIKVSDDGEDALDNWDWRNFLGIVSNVLNQDVYPSCWAIAFTRCIEALFNIGKRLEEQHSFSIQHLLNNVPHRKNGLEKAENLQSFIIKNGVMEEGECSYIGVRKSCAHGNPVIETVDDVVVIDTVDDVELARLVQRHPVVGIVPLWTELETHRLGIFKAPKSKPNDFHAVLIIGFGVDNNGQFYWIIQNSWGEAWMDGGFAHFHRENKRGRGSIFSQVYYGVKKGYPQRKK